MINFNNYFNRSQQLFLEGGLGGHMLHPYQLPEINTGKDLIKLFTKAAAYVSNNFTPLKIDGVNISLRLITNEHGNKEFATDRGSKNPLDIEGLTVNTLAKRGLNPSYTNDATQILIIFNSCIPYIKKELQELGMMNDSTISLNTDFVRPGINVISYKDVFVAVHNLVKIETTYSDKFNGGLQRVKSQVSFNQNVLNLMVDKINKISKTYDVDVVTVVPTFVPKGGNINFEPVLASTLTFLYSSEVSETKSLKVLLGEVKDCDVAKSNVRYLKTGKPIAASAGVIYNDILNSVPLDQIVEEKNYQKVIDSVVLLHSTRLLGQTIKNALKSGKGNVSDHEGIVIHNSEVSPSEFKITGDFIVNKNTSHMKSVLTSESAAWQRKEGKNKTGGLNRKGVASYRRENPGSKLQTAVTTKPSKLKKGSKAAKRRKSFCARMGGVKGPMKKPNGKPTRKALALRKWNC
tara:strand:- start:11243 stop:12628 length:1386 start_codon:yes stop_codon:yes gene_type:complete